MKEEIILQRPTEDFVKKYINKFLNNNENKFKHYPYQEKAVMKLRKEFPNNNQIIEILLKVGILNSFYSTNIFKPFAVAERILQLSIDEKLKKGEILLVHEIAKNKISGKNFYFYSFATKYCSMHNPEAYPIYDSYIGWILYLYKKQHSFCEFGRKDLKDYKKFKEILKKFTEFFRLGEFSFKEIDQFLWTYAKEIKPK